MKNIFKFMFFITYLLLIFWLKNILVLISLFGFHVVGMKLLKMRLKENFYFFQWLFPFALFTGILNVIWADLNTGILITVRLLLVYQITSIFSKLITRTELAIMIQNLTYPLKILGINNEKIGLIVNIAFCVIPILKNEMKQKKNAFKAKGSDLNLRHIFLMLEPVLISILRRTSKMEKCLKAKAYEE